MAGKKAMFLASSYRNVGTSQRHDVMGAIKSKRATIYFDPDLHRGLRLKAAATEQSISDLVDEAVRIVLGEDAEDLAALEARAAEPVVAFEAFVRELKAAGAL